MVSIRNVIGTETVTDYQVDDQVTLCKHQSSFFEFRLFYMQCDRYSQDIIMGAYY
jgi:hypothetical protein